MNAQAQIKRMINNDPVKLVEMVYRVRDNAGRLKDYEMTRPHKLLMRSGLLGNRESLSRIVVKGRQLGFSIYQAVESTLIAQLFPATYQYYIATKEGQAKSWLKKVERVSKDTRLWLDSSRIIDIDSVHSSLLEKVFKQQDLTESYICGLAASPSGAQGETAINLILDEFAWMIQRKNQQEEIYEAAKYFISQGGQLTIQSTPIVSSDKFWQIYTNAKELMFTPFYFPTIENWKDLDLSMDLRKQNCVIPYPWVNIIELEKARRNDLAYFKQRNLGVPMDDMFRFLTPQLIVPHCVSEQEYYGKKTGYYGIAVDVAQKRDITAITVGELDKSIVKERFIAESQEDYTVQAQEIADIAARYPTAAFIAVDTTGGHGRGLVDVLKYKVTMPIKEIEFATTVKILGQELKEKITSVMAVEFKKSITLNNYEFLEHQQALQHCYNVEKIRTDSGTTRYSGKKNGRDDHFWSKAILNYMFMGNRDLFIYSTGGGSPIRQVQQYVPPNPNSLSGSNFLTM